MPTDFFHALHQIVMVINSTLNPEEVFAKITAQTAKTMDCKASTLRLLNPSGTHLLASGAYGLSEAYMRKGPVEVHKSGMDAEVLQGKTIHLTDATSDGRFQYPESAKEEGLVSVLTTPLMVDGKAIGLLRVYSNYVRAFTQDECNFMEAVASVAALAIENARIHNKLQCDFELHTSYSYQIFND